MPSRSKLSRLWGWLMSGGPTGSVYDDRDGFVPRETREAQINATAETVRELVQTDPAQTAADEAEREAVWAEEEASYRKRMAEPPPQPPG